jgi:hypothetical protein
VWPGVAGVVNRSPTRNIDFRRNFTIMGWPFVFENIFVAKSDTFSFGSIYLIIMKKAPSFREIPKVILKASLSRHNPSYLKRLSPTCYAYLGKGSTNFVHVLVYNSLCYREK